MTTTKYPLVTIPSSIYVPVVEEDGELVKLNQWSEQPDKRYEYYIKYYTAGGLHKNERYDNHEQEPQVEMHDNPTAVMFAVGRASKHYDKSQRHELRIALHGDSVDVEAIGQYRRLIFDALRNNPLFMNVVEEIINQIKSQREDEQRKQIKQSGSDT